MYLHIGKEEMIKKENILFLLDYKSIKDNSMSQNFLDSISKENKRDISLNNPKTIIITKEHEKIKAYISNISSFTLSSRKMFEK